MSEPPGKWIWVITSGNTVTEVCSTEDEARRYTTPRTKGVTRMRNPHWSGDGDVFIAYAGECKSQDMSVISDNNTKIFSDKQQARQYTYKVMTENIRRGKNVQAVVVPKYIEGLRPKNEV